MKLIVAGSRGFTDYERLRTSLLSLLQNYNLQDVEIVSGGAYGADKLGEQFAQEHGCKLTIMEANWQEYGKRAGYLRNGDMADYADACVVYWDTTSKGAKHMIDLAQQKGIKLRVVRV